MEIDISLLYCAYKKQMESDKLKKIISDNYQHNHKLIKEQRSKFELESDKLLKKMDSNYSKEEYEEFQDKFYSENPEYAQDELLKQQRAQIKVIINRLLKDANITYGAHYALVYSEDHSRVSLYDFSLLKDVDLSSYDEKFISYLKRILSSREYNAYIRDISEGDIVLVNNIINSLLESNKNDINSIDNKLIRIKYIEALLFEYEGLPRNIVEKQKEAIRRKRLFLEMEYENHQISDKLYKIKCSELDILETHDPETLYLNADPADKELILSAYMNLEKCSKECVRSRGLHINLAVQRRMREMKKNDQ